MSSDNGKHSNLTLAFLMAVSIFGLFLSILFVAYPFTSLEDDFAFRNLTVGSAFSAVCILGMFAALFPSSCSALPKFRKRNEHYQIFPIIHETTLQAHHPSCENYSTHILRIGNMKFCATCSGLVVGAAVALFGTGLCFFAGLRIGDPFVLVSLGAAGVALGLLQSALPKFSSGSTRFLASILFVIGTFLMLIGLDGAVKNISIDLFFVVLSVFWIQTKIALSQRDHQQTCAKCSLSLAGRTKKGCVMDFSGHE
jgi:hypothetical protein